MSLSRVNTPFSAFHSEFIYSENLTTSLECINCISKTACGRSVTPIAEANIFVSSG